MKFRVRRPFNWEGRGYSRGEVIEIPEGHPRLGGMLQGRYVAYDASPEPAKEGLPVQTAQEFRVGNIP